MDEIIGTLIKPPRKVFEGFDWSRTDKLVPTGKAHSDKLIAERTNNRSWAETCDTTDIW